MSDWKPIETAPKDGRTLLLVYEGYVVTGTWRRDGSRWSGVCGIYDVALNLTNPTHWMPLPDPPGEPMSRGLVDDLASDDDAGELKYEREE